MVKLEHALSLAMRLLDQLDRPLDAGLLGFLAARDAARSARGG
jgi:hypothetical protein